MRGTGGGGSRGCAACRSDKIYTHNFPWAGWLGLGVVI